MTSDIEKHATTKIENQFPAPGGPGDKPKWTTGAKTAVGTAIPNESRVWYTVSRGVIDEVYFPSIDQANTRRIQFAIAGPDGYFSTEEHHALASVETPESGVPALRIRTRCPQGRYELTKDVITDPDRDALLMRVRFRADKDLKLFLVLDPHIGDSGGCNDAWRGSYKGISMLFARREGTALALACNVPFAASACGYIGVNDPLTQVAQSGRLVQQYTIAENGNVGMGAEIDWVGAGSDFVVALGFGGHAAEAAQQARAGLLQPFEGVLDCFCNQWREKQAALRSYSYPNQKGIDVYRVSTAVLRTHESARFPGAMIAGLAVPWGFDRGDKDVGGYHVIWPRDAVQAALGNLASGNAQSARGTLFYLTCTQEADGSWPQNMWLDGTANWTSVQMDSAGYVPLLADALARADALAMYDPWPMLRKTAGFLVRNGPVTQQERWEENPGYSPNTMAIEIAALLAIADFAERANEQNLAEFLRETADCWNDAVDELTVIDGYYVRIAPPEVIETGLTHETKIKLKNLPDDQAEKRACDVIGPDALALVRFGLRRADDPRIRNTIERIDAELKKDLWNGPVWHRYSFDGYGEHADGRAFNGTGIGRGWPLLAGERAHYELAFGNKKEAQRLLETMSAQTSECGLIPEQIWDAPDIPEHYLQTGYPTGSGMPLVWAHAEFIRLLRSVNEERVWDTPPQTVQRYIERKQPAQFQIWTFKQRRGWIRAGKKLRIDVQHRTRVRWSSDNWNSYHDADSVDSGIGVHCATLDTSGLSQGATVDFTFFWPDSGEWESQSFHLTVS